MASKFEEVKTSLEIEEHTKQHQRGFVIQKIGLFALFAMVVMAALGLFGDGLLSKRTSSSTGATVEYQRFYRFEARMEVKIDLLAFGNSNVVSFPKEYLKAFEIESINPSPESTNFKGDRSEFVFNGPGNGNITFFLVPRNVGNVDGDVTVNKDRFKLTHFIFP